MSRQLRLLLPPPTVNPCCLFFFLPDRDPAPGRQSPGSPDPSPGSLPRPVPLSPTSPSPSPRVRFRRRRTLLLCCPILLVSPVPGCVVWVASPRSLVARRSSPSSPPRADQVPALPGWTPFVRSAVVALSQPERQLRQLFFAKLANIRFFFAALLLSYL